MTITDPSGEARRCAETFRIRTRPPIYLVGTFDRRVTVLNQQHRALNLVWSLVESGEVPSGRDAGRKRVAIVGGGFAGLTIAAGLAQKQARCDITIFEERDTLLPLQQGSDSRWLHPHIYDWPGEGSNSAAAMLPVLNWTAARASDVVVQVLDSWEEIFRREKPSVTLYCNARHVQLSADPRAPDRAKIEWVAEPRCAIDGTAHGSSVQAEGASATFDIVILAVGFGLEKRNPSSYWRNETLAQPSLGRHRRTFMLSGQGDGAMVDLLRLRISQFRQDRFLDELFEGRQCLLAELKKVREAFLADEDGVDLFSSFDGLGAGRTQLSRKISDELLGALRKMSARLRRDTEVILQLRVRNLSELLQAKTSRTSFQNAFLVYLLYKCGGFTPTTESEATIRARYAIPEDQVIRRHGTRRIEQLRRLMSTELAEAVIGTDPDGEPQIATQSADPAWEGGYFGYPGRTLETDDVRDAERVSWRKEYLPGPTELVATAIVGAVAGHLGTLRPDAKHFRATLHRALPIGNEELLQQASAYVGRDLPLDTGKSGRTFPARNATIGLAYRTRRVIRSTKGVDPDVLREAMAKLDLTTASMQMSKGVRFVLAIPILEPENEYVGPNPTAGVLYVDSKDESFWLDDDEVTSLVEVLQLSVRAIDRERVPAFDRIRNSLLREVVKKKVRREHVKRILKNAIESVDGCEPPRTTRPFTFNFDHSDLTPIVVSATESG